MSLLPVVALDGLTPLSAYKMMQGSLCIRAWLVLEMDRVVDLELKVQTTYPAEGCYGPCCVPASPLIELGRGGLSRLEPEVVSAVVGWYRVFEESKGGEVEGRVFEQTSAGSGEASRIVDGQIIDEDGRTSAWMLGQSMECVCGMSVLTSALGGDEGIDLRRRPGHTS